VPRGLSAAKLDRTPIITHPPRPDANPFQVLIEQFAPGSRLLRVRPMTGGISAQTTSLVFTGPDGTTERVIVRQHGAVDRARNPDIARDEFRLLEIVRARGVAAPAPIHVDASGALFPAPVIVIASVEGEPGLPEGETDAWINQAAEQLARMHRITASNELDFLPGKRTAFAPRHERLDDSMREGIIRQVLEEIHPPAPGERPTLLHGDFWPGNVLWNEGRLTAVIDWEDAAVGDPLADLGTIRLELLWAAGPEAMDRFTERYRQLTDRDFAGLPFWDLMAALRPCGQLGDFGLDAATEQRWRELHRAFVDLAIARLRPAAG
jgi:aminoglycoside phosphotransferase (APT) family kinase protein